MQSDPDTITLLTSSIFLAKLNRLAPIVDAVDVFKVYGDDVAGAATVFARNEVEAERCARAIDAKLRSYPGALIVKYQRTVAVPVRKEQVA